jgi:Glycosyl hydrolase 108
MARFDLAYPVVARHEGGYVNHPADRGGETFRGIARNFHPDWVGWPRIDELRRSGATKAQLDGNQVLKGLVKDFFEKKYWRPFAGIQDQDIATILFDWGVMTNPGLAWKYAAAAGAGDTGKINKLTPARRKKFFEAFKSIRRAHHHRRVETLPSQEVFLTGWLKRTDAFIYSGAMSGSGIVLPLVLGVAAVASTAYIVENYATNRFSHRGRAA